MKQETKNKISQSKKGTIPWNKNKVGLQTAWNKGKQHPKARGKNNGNYKHGKTRLQIQEEIAKRSKSDECEVCRKIIRVDFDHDHKTGKFRGWICRRCNLVLGMVNDDTRILRLLADYLDLSDKKPKVIMKLDALLPNNSNNQDNQPEQEDTNSTGGNIGQ